MHFKRFSPIDRIVGLIENQKPSDRLIMRVLFFAVVISSVYFLLSINKAHTISVPANGGSLVEGIVGIPRFVNPALAITRADQDVTALIYSGLMKIDQNGSLVNDVAESISLSEDNRVYTIKLRQDRKFHDNTPITAKDVVYTMELIKDPDLKSPLRGNWTDVQVEEVGEYELKITLNEAYTPFVENFTLGIMPKHIWSDLPIEQLPFSQYNTEPIGSGPFVITTTQRDGTGLINGYTLKPHDSNIDQANLATINLRFFQNESLLTEAFLNKEITSTIFLPREEISKLDPEDTQIVTKPLPRVFAIFLNQNKSPALRDKSAREALNVAIDRQMIVEKVLGGYGVPTTKPIIEDYNKLKLSDTEQEVASSEETRTAKDILLDGGWTQDEIGLWEKKIDESTETLSVTIRTNNSELYNAITSIIASTWRELGVEVQVEQYEQAGLTESVIRTRDFQALLFGIDINRTQDLYPFWHSSQKNDPGLNIAQYTNKDVDQLLEEARKTTNESERQKILRETSDLISEEVPAIFLFAPSITYVIDNNIRIAPMNALGIPSDRFMNVTKWHASTENIWPIFQNKL